MKAQSTPIISFQQPCTAGRRNSCPTTQLHISLMKRNAFRRNTLGPGHIYGPMSQMINTFQLERRGTNRRNSLRRRNPSSIISSIIEQQQRQQQQQQQQQEQQQQQTQQQQQQPGAQSIPRRAPGAMARCARLALQPRQQCMNSLMSSLNSRNSIVFISSTFPYDSSFEQQYFVPTDLHIVSSPATRQQNTNQRPTVYNVSPELRGLVRRSTTIHTNPYNRLPSHVLTAEVCPAVFVQGLVVEKAKSPLHRFRCLFNSFFINFLRKQRRS